MPGQLVIALAVVVLGAVGLWLAIWSRTSALTRRVGSFTCALRTTGSPPAAPGTGGAHAESVSGVAHYGVGRLDWWRLASLAPRPAAVWRRSVLVVVGRRADPDRPGIVLVRCLHEGEEFELAMSPEACAGLVSWLEAAPVDMNRVL